MKQFSLSNASETLSLGAKLCRQLSRHRLFDVTIFLHGELGSGKTTFVRGFLNAWGYLEHVKSPTFTLIEPYEGISGKIYHFDLYRLSSIDELEMMGIRDYFATEAIRFIEWPQKAQTLLPEPDMIITFEHNTQGRVVQLECLSRRVKLFEDDIE